MIESKRAQVPHSPRSKGHPDSPRRRHLRVHLTALPRPAQPSATDMDEEKKRAAALLDDFAASLCSLDEATRPLLSVLSGLRAASEEQQEEETLSDPLSRARLHITLCYTVNTLFCMYLRTQGVDPTTHPVADELVRVQDAFMRLRKVEVASAAGKRPETQLKQREGKLHGAKARVAAEKLGNLVFPEEQELVRALRNVEKKRKFNDDDDDSDGDDGKPSAGGGEAAAGSVSNSAAQENGADAQEGDDEGQVMKSAKKKKKKLKGKKDKKGARASSEDGKANDNAAEDSDGDKEIKWNTETEGSKVKDKKDKKDKEGKKKKSKKKKITEAQVGDEQEAANETPDEKAPEELNGEQVAGDKKRAAPSNSAETKQKRKRRKKRVSS